MSTFLLTLSLATVFVILSLIGLGIGWLVTGKKKLSIGSCGKDPNCKDKESSSCSVCHDEKCHDEKKRDDDND